MVKEEYKILLCNFNHIKQASEKVEKIKSKVVRRSWGILGGSWGQMTFFVINLLTSTVAALAPPLVPMREQESVLFLDAASPAASGGVSGGREAGEESHSRHSLLFSH